MKEAISSQLMPHGGFVRPSPELWQISHAPSVYLYTWLRPSTSSKKVTRQLAQELNRKPTEQELAKSMDVSIVKLHEIIKAAKEPISLETPIGKEEDSRLGDFIEDAETDRPETTVTHELLRQDLAKMLNELTPRERDVLRLRFGLDDGRQRTLEEVDRKSVV